MSLLSDLCRENYIIFLCEGTNEEEALLWLRDESKLELDLSYCNFDYLRKLRTRKHRSQHLKEMLRNDYDRPPALVYLLDSLKEVVQLPKEFSNIPIYYVYTHPEFEILIIIHKNKYHEFIRRRRAYKASEFARELFEKNIKSKGTVHQAFDYDVHNLVDAARQLKQIYAQKSELRDKNGIYDLCS